MTHLGAFLALTSVGALVLAGLARAASLYNEDGRLILRGLRNVLEGKVQAHLIDIGRRRGMGFDFASMMMAVTWDGGEWCLVYRIDELLGMELIVDEWVIGWAFAREPLSRAQARAVAKEHVCLRLSFADARYADFALELWSADRADRSTAPSAREAIELGNRWLVDMYRLLNRTPLPEGLGPDPRLTSPEMPSFRMLASDG